MSTPSWFDPKLSIGNVLTIMLVMFGIFAGWFQFSERVALLEAEQRRTAATVERMERDRSDITTRVIRIEERLTGQSEVLQRILRNTEAQTWRPEQGR